MIRIDDERCTGCGACVEACPTGVIRLTEGAAGIHAEIDEERCQECRACVEVCPEEAIISEVKPIIEGELVQVKATPVLVEPRPRGVEGGSTMRITRWALSRPADRWLHIANSSAVLWSSDPGATGGIDCHT
jgi:NAD-dependent dihydropyrimidine dehydrogenase PreA subunit